MYIDRVLFPIETLGPGNRLVLWTRGCTKHCVGCANPELWDTNGSKSISVEDITTIILNIHKETPIDGITISGGDPLEQSDEIFELLENVKPYINDILLYTGYDLSYIKNDWSHEKIHRLISLTSVLIDGQYVSELNDNRHALIGSTNQKIHYFDESVLDIYVDYLSKGRKIQNVYMGSKLISVGIHNKA